MPKLVPILAGVLAGVILVGAADPAKPAAEPGKPERPAAKVRKAVDAERAERERAIREFLRSLPQEKRQQALVALKKVWEDEDVTAAREQLRQATEHYKKTVRRAVEETDPEVRQLISPLVNRSLKDSLTPGSGQRKAGEGQGPVRYLRLIGISPEKLDSLAEEEKAVVSSLKDRLMTEPRVKEALAKVDAAPTGGGARVAALRELRQTAKKVALELEPRLGPILDRNADPMP